MPNRCVRSSTGGAGTRQPIPDTAVVGTAGEIIFPLLLIVGLLGRYAALGQHYLWGLMLVTLVVYGPGVVVDRCAIGRAQARPLELLRKIRISTGG